MQTSMVLRSSSRCACDPLCALPPYTTLTKRDGTCTQHVTQHRSAARRSTRQLFAPCASRDAKVSQSVPALQTAAKARTSSNGARLVRPRLPWHQPGSTDEPPGGAPSTRTAPPPPPQQADFTSAVDVPAAETLKQALLSCSSISELHQLLPRLAAGATPHLLSVAFVRFAHLLTDDATQAAYSSSTGSNGASPAGSTSSSHDVTADGPQATSPAATLSGSNPSPASLPVNPSDQQQPFTAQQQPPTAAPGSSTPAPPPAASQQLRVARQVLQQLHQLLAPQVPDLVLANCAALLWSWAKVHTFNEQQAAAARAAGEARTAAAARGQPVSTNNTSDRAAGAPNAAVGADAAASEAAPGHQHQPEQRNLQQQQPHDQHAAGGVGSAVDQHQQQLLHISRRLLLAVAQQLVVCGTQREMTGLATRAGFHVARSAWAAAVLQLQQPALWMKLHRLMAAVAPALEPRELANCMWAIAASPAAQNSLRSSSGAAVQGRTSWQALMDRALELQQQLGAVDVAAITWAVAQQPDQATPGFVNTLVDLTSRQAQLLQPKELCMVASAFAQLLNSYRQRLWGPARLQLSHLLLRRSEQLVAAGSLTPRQQVVLVHALALLNCMAPDLQGRAASAADEDAPANPTAGRQGGGRGDGSSAGLSMREQYQQQRLQQQAYALPVGQRLLHIQLMCCQLAHSAAAAAAPAQLTWQELTMLSRAVASLHQHWRVLQSAERAAAGTVQLLSPADEHHHKQQQQQQQQELPAVEAAAIYTSSGAAPAAQERVQAQRIQQELLEATTAVLQLMSQRCSLLSDPLSQQGKQQGGEQGMQQQLSPHDTSMLLWSSATLVALVCNRNSNSSSSSGSTIHSNTNLLQIRQAIASLPSDNDIPAVLGVVQHVFLPQAQLLAQNLKFSSRQLAQVVRACGLLITLAQQQQQQQTSSQRQLPAGLTSVSTVAAAAAGEGLLLSSSSLIGPAAVAAGAAAAQLLGRLLLVLRAELVLMDVRELGHLVQAAAAAGLRDPDLLDDIARAARRPATLSKASAWEVARLVSGLARLEHTDEQLLAAAADVLLRDLHTAWLPTLATAAWGFAQSGHCDEELFQELQAALMAKVTPSSSPRHLAAVAWAFATAEVHGAAPLMQRITAAALVQGPGAFSLQQLASLCWGLGRCQWGSRELLTAVMVDVERGVWQVQSAAEADAAATLACVLVDGAPLVHHQQVVLQLVRQVVAALQQQQQQRQEVQQSQEDLQQQGPPPQQQGPQLQRAELLPPDHLTGSRSAAALQLSSSSSPVEVVAPSSAVSSPTSERTAAEVACDAAWALGFGGLLLGEDWSAAEGLGVTQRTPAAGTAVGTHSCNCNEGGADSLAGGSPAGSSSWQTGLSSAQLCQQLLQLALTDLDDLAPADLARLTWVATAAGCWRSAETGDAQVATALAHLAVASGSQGSAAEPSPESTTAAPITAGSTSPASSSSSSHSSRSSGRRSADGLAGPSQDLLGALWSAVAAWGAGAFTAADAQLLWQASCWSELQQQGCQWWVQQLAAASGRVAGGFADVGAVGASGRQVTAGPSGRRRQAGDAEQSSDGAPATAAGGVSGKRQAGGAARVQQLLLQKIFQAGKRAAAAKAVALCGSPLASSLAAHLKAHGLTAAVTLQPGRFTSQQLEALQPLQVLTHVWVMGPQRTQLQSQQLQHSQQESPQQLPVALLVLLAAPGVPASGQAKQQQQEDTPQASGAGFAASAAAALSGTPGGLLLLLQQLAGQNGQTAAGEVQAASGSEQQASTRMQQAVVGCGGSRVQQLLQLPGCPVECVAQVQLESAGHALEVLWVLPAGQQ